MKSIGLGAIESMFNVGVSEWQAENDQQRAIELKKMDQEWNSIDAQVERMKKAGLNPAAMLSNGNPSTPVQGGTPGKSNSVKASLLESALISEQVRNLSANTANIEADVALKEKDLEIKDQEKKNLDATEDNIIADTAYKNSMRELTDSKILSEAVNRELVNTNISLNKLQVQIDGITLEYKRAFEEKNLDRISSEIDNLDALTKKTKAEFESTLVQIEQQKFNLKHMSPAQLSNLVMSTGYQAQQILVAEVQKELMRSGIELNDANRDRINKLVGQEYQNLLAQNDLLWAQEDATQMSIWKTRSDIRVNASTIARNQSAIEANAQWIDEGTSRKFSSYTFGLSQMINSVSNVVSSVIGGSSSNVSKNVPIVYGANGNPVMYAH